MQVETLLTNATVNLFINFYALIAQLTIIKLYVHIVGLYVSMPHNVY